MRPKILFGSALLEGGRGGIARVARLTARCLAERGDVSIVSLLDSHPVAIARACATPCHGSKLAFAARCQTGSLRASHIIFDQAGISRSLVSFNPMRRKIALWMHGIEIWQQAKPSTLAAISKADILLVNSHFTLAKHEELYGKRAQARVCWLGTEEDAAPERAPIRSGPPTALMLGRVDGVDGFKGHGELLDAWPAVVAAIPSARLIFAGGGPALSQLQNRCAGSPVSASISCLGFVPENEIEQLWTQANVFAMPSGKEGFGLVFVEAMRRSLPVISTIHDAGPEINPHGTTGLNIDLTKPGDLSRALIELLSNPDRAQAMGQAGFARWQSEFSYTAFARRLNTILDEFLPGCTTEPDRNARPMPKL